MDDVSMKGADLPQNSNADSKRNQVGIAPAGTHLVRVYGVAYMGEALTEFKGEQKTVRPIRIFVELVNEKVVFFEGEEARPFGLSYELNYTRGDKSKMATVICPWQEVEYSDEWFNNFNIFSLVGTYALATVAHTKKKNKPGEMFAEIKTLAPPMKGLELTAGMNDNYAYSARMHGTWSEAWLRLPLWLRKNVYDDKFKTFTDFEQMKANGCVVWDKDQKPEGKTMESTDFIDAVTWKAKAASKVAHERSTPEASIQEEANPLDALPPSKEAVASGEFAEEEDDLPF